MWSLRGCSPWITFPAMGSSGTSGWIKLAAITAGRKVNRWVVIARTTAQQVIYFKVKGGWVGVHHAGLAASSNRRHEECVFCVIQPLTRFLSSCFNSRKKWQAAAAFLCAPCVHVHGFLQHTHARTHAQTIWALMLFTRCARCRVVRNYST